MSATCSRILKGTERARTWQSAWRFTSQAINFYAPQHTRLFEDEGTRQVRFILEHEVAQNPQSAGRLWHPGYFEVNACAAARAAGDHVCAVQLNQKVRGYGPPMLEHPSR